MKRKPDFSAAVSYRPTAANMFPVIQDHCTEAQTTEYATPALSPVVTPRKAEFRQLVHAKWRIGEYRIPEDCTGYMLGTTAILSPRKSTDRKTQQIQQHNYDSFIRIMADMIRKYGPKVQSSKEDLR